MKRSERNSKRWRAQGRICARMAAALVAVQSVQSCAGPMRAHVEKAQEKRDEERPQRRRSPLSPSNHPHLPTGLAGDANERQPPRSRSVWA